MRIASRVLSLTVALALASGGALLDVPGVSAATVSANAKKAFIAGVASPAQKAQRSYGVPASVSIAQAIVASEWGTSKVADAHNYFDTRCSAALTATQFATLLDAQVGKPYVLGAEAAISNTDPAKFDCSELVEWSFGRAGNPITDLAAAQYNVTKRVTGAARVGDLVFLRNNPARSNGIGHVAILTKKLAGGDWRVIEARGRASGVVRTTLSYWKSRRYYAGLRRYSRFVLAGRDSVTASAASAYQAGCLTVSGIRYARFGSATSSFAAHAAAIARDAAYAPARAVIGNLPSYVTAVAKVARPKDAAAYAARINDLIDEYDLREYDVVPLNLLLDKGDRGAKVTAIQYLLGAAGHKVATTGSYDSATVAAVKRFQRAKDLEVDGETGPITLNALMGKLSSGAKGGSVHALHALLAANGYTIDSSSGFGAKTTAAVQAFQADAGRPVTGTVDKQTWAALFMILAAPKPKVTGTPKVGRTLSAVTGTWKPGSVTLSYQWFRGQERITGATRAAYSLTLADAGASLRVRVTGTKRLYTPTVRMSAATATVPLLTLTAAPIPTVSGTARVGRTLTARPGSWGPAPVDLAYQWYRGEARIAGATASSYTLTTEDAGSALKVSVTGTKTGYQRVSRTSAATATVPKLLTAVTPIIAGTAKVGATLTARPGAWQPGSVRLAYQWYRGASAIKGATKASYKVAAADVGATLTVKVTGSLGGYTTVSRVSAATEAVAKGTLQAKQPRISGKRTAGSTLTAHGGDWGPGAVKLGYQWYRNGAAIKGATRTTYKLTSKDRAKTVSVVVRGTKTGYTAETAKASTRIAR